MEIFPTDPSERTAMERVRQSALTLASGLGELAGRESPASPLGAALDRLYAETGELLTALEALDVSLETPSRNVEPERAVVREEVLDELRAESPELLAHLIGLFHETSTGVIDALAAAAEAGDIETVGDRAHYLKGSAANFGAERLMAFCQAMEEMARRGDREGPKKLLDPLRGAYKEVARSLQEKLAS